MLPLSSRAGRVRVVPAGVLVALVAALLAVLLPAAPARAEDRAVQGGRLDWGIKSSFLSYVTGPIAQGSWGLTGGAATVGSGQFRFHSARGSYDPATGAFEAAFSGGVRFTGHKKADGSNELDLAVSSPRIRISGGRGTLYADMTSKAKGSGVLSRRSGVPLARLDVSGVDMRGGGSPVVLSGVPATLTAQGASAFSGYYPAGTRLDPLSLSVDVRAAKRPTASATPGTPSKSPGGAAATGGLTDAAVDWGVRRTFREYVTGAIAQGRWTLADGAQDGGALFRFPKGTGTYDPAKQTLDAAFAGSVRFTGDRLDLTLGKVTVKVENGRGTLAADVTSTGAAGRTTGRTAGRTTEKAVPLITFTVPGLAPKNGLAVVTEAPATLTEGGAKAFGGMYKAGTAMDPVSLAVAVDRTAQLPPLPDLGSDPKPSAPATTPAPAATPGQDSGGTTAVAAEKAANSGPTTATWIAIGAGVLLAAAIAFAAARRRRPGTEAGTEAEPRTEAETGTEAETAPDAGTSRPGTDSPS
ncbi:HtaA domain-containing protein [Streptomyces sp. NPDC090025]|uniref:HtaA domain-containing protein n=1 Tax=Streptomyces sp. NPDC090025 TaxID=3365922 RepID=UPI0038366720